MTAARSQMIQISFSQSQSQSGAICPEWVVSNSYRRFVNKRVKLGGAVVKLGVVKLGVVKQFGKFQNIILLFLN